MAEIVLGGVGGQGIVSLGRIILETAIANQQQAIGVETHGLSQRGGSVVFHARIGNYNSPLVPEGNADFLISLEAMETLRYVHFLNKEKGIVLLNAREIIPTSIVLMGKNYPDIKQITEPLDKQGIKYQLVPALDIATRLNSPRSENIVLLGALLYHNEIFPLDTAKEVIANRWPKVKESNLKALQAGYDYAKEHAT